MKLATIILSFIFIASKETSILTGQVVLDNEPLANCKVEIIENGTSQLTDTEGKFRLAIENLNKATLTISYVDRLASKTTIREIKLEKNEINLGSIPLFFNTTISIENYEKLPDSEKKKYEEVRHWVQLIGYVSANKVDITAVWTTIRVNKKVKYLIDTLDNTVIINYKDWRK